MLTARSKRRSKFPKKLLGTVRQRCESNRYGASDAVPTLAGTRSSLSA